MTRHRRKHSAEQFEFVFLTDQQALERAASKAYPGGEPHCQNECYCLWFRVPMIQACDVISNTTLASILQKDESYPFLPRIC